VWKRGPTEVQDNDARFVKHGVNDKDEVGGGAGGRRRTEKAYEGIIQGQLS
jgi:hypothetical protein